MDTDDAPAMVVLVAARTCAASWRPDARILGNIRAGDLVRSIDAALGEIIRSITPDEISKAIQDQLTSAEGKKDQE